MGRQMFGMMTLAGMILVGLMPPKLAYARDPICRTTSVVEEMTREIRAVDYYTNVDSRLVTEQPTADPRIVRCQVCVELAPYDSLRFGDRPIERCIAHNFEVHIVPRGFVVQELR